MKYLTQIIIAPLMLLLWMASTPLMAADSFVALMYHRFGEDSIPSTNIRMEQFRAHLKYLKDGGFNVISLQQADDFLRKGKELPEKAVLITVDDAYLSVYKQGWPLLQEYDFPFTVFVATDPVDQKLNGYMTWEQMREMQASGVQFANHSATHNSMLRQKDESRTAWLKRIEADVNKSMRRLNEELDPFIGMFAYPFGEFELQSGNLMREKGYIAFGQQSGAIGTLSDKRWLPRYPMNENYGEMDEFRTKVNSLPLPVVSVQPEDYFTSNRRPRLEIELADAGDRIAELACYVGGQGRVPVTWLEPDRKFRVEPVEDLPNGRNRINCTAPTDSGRFQWFSHQWVINTPATTP
jgi:peptidoglycan/xylan/chitin deacetylase (PgdA/CDA1 family)